MQTNTYTESHQLSTLHSNKFNLPFVSCLMVKLNTVNLSNRLSKPPNKEVMTLNKAVKLLNKVLAQLSNKVLANLPMVRLSNKALVKLSNNVLIKLCEVKLCNKEVKLSKFSDPTFSNDKEMLVYFEVSRGPTVVFKAPFNRIKLRARLAVQVLLRRWSTKPECLSSRLTELHPQLKPNDSHLYFDLN